MSSRFQNKRKKKALKGFDKPSIDNEDDTLTKRCKFNFSYLDETQKAGYEISKMSQKGLRDLVTKLKEFSLESIKHWEEQKRYTAYGKFPPPDKTEFIWPKSVPHQAFWGRFRIAGKFRLAGFTVPSDYGDKLHDKTGKRYDYNTFYVVFIDKDHKFWISER